MSVFFVLFGDCLNLLVCVCLDWFDDCSMLVIVSLS